MPTPSGVWLVDEIQPVAAFVGTADSTGAGVSPRLVDWGRTPLAPPGSPRVAIADRDGLAVQDGDGAPVVRVAADGEVRVHPVPGLVMRTAHDGDIWLTGDTAALDPSPGRREQSPPSGEGLIVAVDFDGNRREFIVDHPAPHIAADPRGLLISVDEQPTTSHISGLTSLPTITVVLGWDDRSPRLRLENLPRVPTPRRSRRAWMWRDRDPEAVQASAVAGLGLLWSAGRLTTGSGPDRAVVVTGHDPGTLAQRVRVELGIGHVLDVAVVDPEVWLAVQRGRSVDRDHPVQVVAITALGRVRVVLDADTVDITGRCRPLVTADEDTRRDYPRRECESHGDLQAYWHHPDGATAPLAEGMSEAAVAVDGDWPDTVLEFTCRHPSRPGLLLRRRVPLFDDFGRPTEPSYAGIHLMENLETRWLPPVDDARNGVLDI